MTDTKVEREPRSGLYYRWRPADEPPGLQFLMFHGLTGNENVMWVLESALPSGAFIAAPRGPYPLDQENSFSWVDPAVGDGINRADFAGGLEQASSWVGALVERHGLDLARTVFVGFSQGSALAFLLAEQQQTCPAALVSLAGYLPGGDLAPLNDLPVFWGHGSQDQTIPISRARLDVQRLEGLGARVRFCEADVGHKVGVECMRGLKEWLRNSIT